MISNSGIARNKSYFMATETYLRPWKNVSIIYDSEAKNIEKF